MRTIREPAELAEIRLLTRRAERRADAYELISGCLLGMLAGAALWLLVVVAVRGRLF